MDTVSFFRPGAFGLVFELAVFFAVAGSFGGPGPKGTNGDSFFSVDSVTFRSLISLLSFGQGFNLTVALPFFLCVTCR